MKSIISSKKSRKNYPDDANFKKLYEMVKNGDLDIKLILANPRTGSTLLETSFIKNATVNTHIHEPFHGSENAEDAQRGYATIFEKVAAEAKTSLQPINIVVKEISRRLAVGDEYQRFLTLVKSSPIILVRNPLLSTESKIRAVLKGLNLKKSASLQNIILNYYARTIGYNNANELILSHDDIPNDDVNDEIMLLYRKFIRDNDKEQDESQFRLQNRLLEYFAVSKGYKSWQSMLEETFAFQDYKPFEDILIDERIYKLELPATLKQMHYLQSMGRSFIIVDSTDYRLDPKTIITTLCEKWNMPFSNTMIEWGHKGKKLLTEQTNLNVWFERVQNSTRIDQPNEISPVLTGFPDFIANHLKDIEFPAYYEMFSHLSRARPTKMSFQKQIDVPVTKGVYRRLQEIGIIPPELDLIEKKDFDQEIFHFLKKRKILSYSSHETTSLEEEYKNGIASIKLPIFYLDPIFSLMSDSKFINDKRFLNVNKRYLPTLNIVTELVNSDIGHS